MLQIQELATHDGRAIEGKKAKLIERPKAGDCRPDGRRTQPPAVIIDGMRNLVILISGSGSNMRAIHQAAQRADWPRHLGARVAAVISNRPQATGLDYARAQGLDALALDHRSYPSREAFDAALAQAIDAYAPGGPAAQGADQPVWVVLAGFMRILSAGFVARYVGRLTNIHPALLPAFAGLDTHARAIAAGCRVAGATVHQVTAELDHGPIIDQAVVPILPGDDAQRLAARVLSQEHLLYPRALEQALRADLG